MPLSMRSITPTFAGEVSGVDLRAPLPRDEVAAIEAGMDRCAVLVFRDQPLTDDQQIAFTLNSGSLEHARGGHPVGPSGTTGRPRTACGAATRAELRGMRRTTVAGDAMTTERAD
jgi:alpha-ketoglutarate-dependent taurine dioxygenase